MTGFIIILTAQYLWVINQLFVFWQFGKKYIGTYVYIYICLEFVQCKTLILFIFIDLWYLFKHKLILIRIITLAVR